MRTKMHLKDKIPIVKNVPDNRRLILPCYQQKGSRATAELCVAEGGSKILAMNVALVPLRGHFKCQQSLLFKSLCRWRGLWVHLCMFVIIILFECVWECVLMLREQNYSYTYSVLAWRCHTHNSSQNMSLISLHWAVIMGRVSTEPGEKMPLHSIGYLQPIRTT